MPRIYLSPPHLSGRELELLQEAIESNWVAPLGPQVDAFEAELARLAGVEHTLALSSGTAALHLALVVLGIGAGGEVVCSSLTFSASANPIRFVGATPVFVDACYAYLKTRPTTPAIITELWDEVTTFWQKLCPPGSAAKCRWRGALSKVCKANRRSGSGPALASARR